MSVLPLRTQVAGGERIVASTNRRTKRKGAGIVEARITCPQDAQDPKKTGGKAKVVKADKEKGHKEEVKPEEENKEAATPTVKDLLEEASKMLKTLNSSPSSSSASPTSSGGDERQEVVERSQQQLKAFRLMRLQKGEKAGLLDSGATHPLRPSKRGENKDSYERVQVAYLADGQTTWLPISPGGAMIAEGPDIEPIIPMKLLTKDLGCSIAWSKGHLEVTRHPKLGVLPVEDHEGCLQVPKKLAIQLIEELEQVKRGMKFQEVDDFKEELKDLVQTHPLCCQVSLKKSKVNWLPIQAHGTGSLQIEGKEKR